MMNFIPFSPKKHKGYKLYEMQSVREGDIISTVIVPSDATYEQARRVPFYYFVDANEKVEKVDKKNFITAIKSVLDNVRRGRNLSQDAAEYIVDEVNAAIGD